MFFRIIDFISSIGYRSFTEENVYKWIKKYRKESENLPDNTKNIIQDYCKEDKPTINRYLREELELDEKLLNYMKTLDKILSNTIGENIIVYRNLNKDPFYKNLSFTEKGYMSTSLIDGEISAIHRGKIMLKILLPSSCKGFYVDYISRRTGEYEMLLKRGIKLKKISYINQKERTLILCKAELN